MSGYVLRLAAELFILPELLTRSKDLVEEETYFSIQIGDLRRCEVSLSGLLGRRRRQSPLRLIPSEVMDRLNQLRGVFEFSKSAVQLPTSCVLLSQLFTECQYYF